MKHCIVTIILATYNRPDTLDAVIKSVINQSLSNWQLFVVGDNCDNRTDNVIKNNIDSRIKYLNLPDRFGEQSGPNSVGLSLVNTPYVSYLNHDDIWLPDHLELGINMLKKHDFDFYIGGAAYSRYIDFSETSSEILVDEFNTADRSPMDLFARNTAKYEPASSWIIKHEVAKKIGFWNYYTELYRAPSEDYLMRAWRLKYKFYFSTKVTTWAIVTQYVNDTSQMSYEYNSKEHKEVLELVISNTSDDMRSILDRKLYKWNSMTEDEKTIITSHYNILRPNTNVLVKRSNKLMKNLFINKFTAKIYLVFGLDIFSVVSVLRGKKKGFLINYLIKERTGDVPPKPNLSSVIKRVQNEVYGN